ncbi:tyrosine-type recombinase/integrase [Mycobacterium sp. IS-1742]|uniref:tyrosine-type recombinase/integrase n=1 Tax=Mycobacterium sp. IS-1742 TaxID=1772285 RepID=UPI000A40BCC1|nr:tyrosine-type recombinase/integrase [Mycobacterium sp. IS-1742]
MAGTIDDITIEGYAKIYCAHIGPVFGSRPVASITTADVTAFRAALLKPHKRHQGNATVVRSPKTVKHIIGTLRRILNTAQDDQAIAANPVIAGRRYTTKRRAADHGRQPFKHRPLTANQVASVVDWIATTRDVTIRERNAEGVLERRTYTRQGNDIYALAVLFAAHTGVRAAELQGVQIRDVILSEIPGTVGGIRVVRTATRKGRQWVYGTPKSDASSDRVVPLAPWLADDLRDYLTRVHPFAGKHPHAPLFPGRRDRHTFDWAHPVHAGNLYEHYLQPACRALKLGNVRFHDLRHTFATMNLSAGEHYMQVSKWLGHSTFVLTLTTYADYINDDDQAAPKVACGVAETGKVVPLQRKAN